MFLLWLLFLCFSPAFALDEYVPINEKIEEICVCVPYWQCKEDFSGLVEDGIDIIDIRMLRNAPNPSDQEPQNSCTGDFDVCCKLECGKRRSLSEPTTRLLPRPSEVLGFRILGENNEATFAEFPWMLGILHDKTYRCGGSLIHPQVALTAAHCLTGSGPFKVRAGEHNWESWSEPIPHQDRLIKRVIFHAEYHSGSLRNDIALIILEKPFQMTENIGVACLPRRSISEERPDCLATGWGKNGHRKGTYQATLKKMTLPLVGRTKCQRNLQIARLGPRFSLHRSFICAGGEANKDTCKGDGGSPLVCPVEDEPERFEQVGIVSWGLTCGVQNTPGVYVNVALFSDWVDKQMALNGFDTTIYRYN